MTSSRRVTILLVNLALVLLCILGLQVVVAGYTLLRSDRALAIAATPTQTMRPSWTPTLTATPSHTPTPSLTPPVSRTPTLTVTPSITPTPTETRPLPGPATLTPAYPRAFSDEYDLAEWTPELADQVVQLMENYPDTLNVREKNPAAYYAAFRYAVDARKEALLRFPDASQASDWRWGLALDLARSGDPQAGEVYADLIAAALNQAQSDVAGLPVWFQAQQPESQLYMVDANPPPGYVGSYILEVRHQGSAFIWVLQSASSFQATPLFTRFDFIHDLQARWILTDLDNNPTNGDEIAIYFTTTSPQYELEPPVVFSLSQLPPLQMPFLPAQESFTVGVEYDNYWGVRQKPGAPGDLYFRTTVFPACPVTLRRDYRWNQVYYTFASQTFEFTRPEANLSGCLAVINHAASTWGPEAAIPIMETLLPAWPPAEDEQGNPYPADAKDEYIFRLGIYHALAAHYDEAVRYMNTVAYNPTIYDSRWIAPAQEFLRVYRQPQSIYIACKDAPFCDPDYAIQYLIDTAPAVSDIYEYLARWGVRPASRGYYDFDLDDEAERWFTIRNIPRQKLSFWVIARYSQGLRALLTDYVDSSQPRLEYLEEAFIADESLAYQPAVLLDSKTAFSMQRLPASEEPYLVDVALRQEYPSRFWIGVQKAAEALETGLSPEIVKDQLLELRDDPGLLCAPTWSCDPYYYLLGLSSELAGDERLAVKCYHYLWSSYSRSPYTTIARLKLSGKPLVTDTPTPTITLTPTLTGTPTLTSAPTVTGTPPTGTPTHSPTPTTSGTPGTETPTGTPATATPSPTPSPTATTDTYPQPTDYPTATIDTTKYPPP